MSEDPERAFPGTRVVSKQIKSNQILASLRRGPPEERRGRRELDTARRAPFRKRASRQPQTRQSGEGISGNVPLSVMAADSDPHRRTHRTTATWELFPTNRIFSGAAYESGAKQVERWATHGQRRPRQPAGILCAESARGRAGFLRRTRFTMAVAGVRAGATTGAEDPTFRLKTVFGPCDRRGVRVR
jgi:hypothetical protein